MGTGIRLVWEAALEPCGKEWRGREGRQEGVVRARVLQERTAHHAPKKKPQYYMQGKFRSFTLQVLISRIKWRKLLSY